MFSPSKRPFSGAAGASPGRGGAAPQPSPPPPALPASSFHHLFAALGFPAQLLLSDGAAAHVQRLAVDCLFARRAEAVYCRSPPHPAPPAVTPAHLARAAGALLTCLLRRSLPSAAEASLAQAIVSRGLRAESVRWPPRAGHSPGLLPHPRPGRTRGSLAARAPSALGAF